MGQVFFYSLYFPNFSKNLTYLIQDRCILEKHLETWNVEDSGPSLVMSLEEIECELHQVCAWQDIIPLIGFDEMQDRISSLQQYHLVLEGRAQHLLGFP